MSALTDELDGEWSEFMVATNAQGKRTIAETWRRANPGEWQKLETYRAGGARPTLATNLGRQMVRHVAARKLAGTTPTPTPTTLYPATTRYPAEVI